MDEQPKTNGAIPDAVREALVQATAESRVPQPQLPPEAGPAKPAAPTDPPVRAESDSPQAHAKRLADVVRASMQGRGLPEISKRALIQSAVTQAGLDAVVNLLAATQLCTSEEIERALAYSYAQALSRIVDGPAPQPVRVVEPTPPADSPPPGEPLPPP